jgi:DNA-binding transcriptional ArsR family regulator
LTGSEVDNERRQAEVFDALGHPTRILILKAVSEEPMGFADLKKKLNMESSGHIQHHLNKLGGLIKTDDYGKYTLSDQGKDALISVETVEKVAKSGARQYGKAHDGIKNVALKSAVIALAFLLVVSSTIAWLEYRNGSSYQNTIEETNSTIGQLNSTIGQLNSTVGRLTERVNFGQLTVNIKPLASHYLTTTPAADGDVNLTKIFLVSAEASYIGLPPWSIYPVAPITYVGNPFNASLTVIASVRNDYTAADAGNSNNLNAPIGYRTSGYASFVALTLRLFSQNGTLIQTTDAVRPANGNGEFALGSGEILSYIFKVYPSSPEVAQYNIYVSYLSSNQ